MPTLKCGNCGRTLGCACKRRTAKDGTKCCTLCVTAKNNSLSSHSNVNELRRAQRKLK